MATKSRKLRAAEPPAVEKPTSYTSSAVAVQTSSADRKVFAAAVACKLTRPEVTAAAVIESWQKDTHDVNELVAELARQVDAVGAGDLRRAEGMLIAQAHALDNIFANLARRATNQQYLPQWEAYMRMAMKAQNQCRMTLETLATIKNPPVVFARQANINNGGQQQVNNCSVPEKSPHAHAENAVTAPTELPEAAHELLTDIRASSAVGRTLPSTLPVGAVNRPAHG
jgi:hypothetical protein